MYDHNFNFKNRKVIYIVVGVNCTWYCAKFGLKAGIFHNLANDAKGDHSVASDIDYRCI